MGYQLSHKRNKGTSVVCDKRSYMKRKTIVIQELQATCQSSGEIPMGRAQRRRLREVTKNLKTKTQLQYKARRVFVNSDLLLLWALIQTKMIFYFWFWILLILLFIHCLPYILIWQDSFWSCPVITGSLLITIHLFIYHLSYIVYLLSFTNRYLHFYLISHLYGVYSFTYIFI